MTDYYRKAVNKKFGRIPSSTDPLSNDNKVDIDEKEERAGNTEINQTESLHESREQDRMSNEPNSATDDLNKQSFSATEHDNSPVFLHCTEGLTDSKISSSMLDQDKAERVSSNDQFDLDKNNEVTPLGRETSAKFSSDGNDFQIREKNLLPEEEGTLDVSLTAKKLDIKNFCWNCPPSDCVEEFHGVLAKIESKDSVDKKSKPISLPVRMLNVTIKILQHFCAKCFIVLLGAAIILPLGFILNILIAFICGILLATVAFQMMSELTASEFGKSKNPSATKGKMKNSQEKLFIKSSTKSQSWMLQFKGDYNAGLTSFHDANPVFMRLDHGLLYISIPNPKQKVPKRKLSNDVPFKDDIKFVRHEVYNLIGAEIIILPDKLASRRVWNKKYPIGIRMSSASDFWEVTQVKENSSSSTATEDDKSCSDSSDDSGITEDISLTTIKGDKKICRKKLEVNILYLFSRTCREKEDWFRRFIDATKTPDSLAPISELLQDYTRYMENIIPNLRNSIFEGSQGAKNEEYPKKAISDASKENPVFLNALLGRIFYDASRSPFWSLQLQNKIQLKLNAIKLPPFIEMLLVKDLSLGSSFPIIQALGSPIMDSRGLWFDLDINYKGDFCLTLEAKINLFKLGKTSSNVDKQEADSEGDDGAAIGFGIDSSKEEGNMVRNLYDSEDSGESEQEESDAEEIAKLRVHDNAEKAPKHTRGKVMQAVGKVQHAIANFVKSAIGNTSTSILLTIEVKEADGTMTLNFAAPPTNRIWIAFREKPRLELVVSPKLEKQSMNLNPFTDWIKQKLQEQIQRVLVLPNMDDNMIGIMEFKLPA